MPTEFRALLEAAPDGIVIADRAGTITFANAQAEKLFGYQLAELLGQSIELLVPERLRHKHLAHRVGYFRAPRARPMGADLELYARLKSGDEVPVEISLSPIETADGTLVMSAIRDVTDRRAAQKAAQEANRIKDEFLATLSHELRTPLNSILGWSTMLATGNLDAATSLRAIQSVIRGARQQSQLIDDLLDVSRIVKGSLRLNVQTVVLATVIDAAIDTVRPAATAKSIDLQVILDREAAVMGDPVRLQQIAWNLLSNAVKYTPPGGGVVVTLDRADSYARLVVRDTGRGIAPGFLPFVFERFRQGDSSHTRSTGGLGLGLAIVRDLVELHGGSVLAESAGEDLGATFTVRIPIRAVKPDRRHRTSSLQETPFVNHSDPGDLPDLSGITILVVDDDAETRELLTMIVAAAGARVISAASSSGGFEMVTQSHPDIVICDIGMPVEDGYSFIRKVRRLSPAHGGRIPAVAVTAYARAEDRKRSLRAGFQSHVAKPAEPAELLAVVAALVGRTDTSEGPARNTD